MFENKLNTWLAEYHTAVHQIWIGLALFLTLYTVQLSICHSVHKQVVQTLFEAHIICTYMSLITPQLTDQS